MNPSTDHYPLQPVEANGLVVRAAAEPAAPPPALSGPPSMEALWHALRRRWLSVLLLGLLGALAGAVAACYLVPARYAAVALVHIDPRAANEGHETETDFLGYVRTQTALLKSASTLRSVVQKPTVAELPEIRGQDDPVGWLEKNLLVDSLLGPEILRVTLSGDRAEDVAVIVNELAQNYLRMVNAKKDARVGARIKQLEQNYNTSSARLRDMRIRHRTLCDALHLADPRELESRMQMALQQMTPLQNIRLQNELLLRQKQSELEAMQEQLLAPEKLPITEFAILEELKTDTAYRTQFDRLAGLDAHIQALEAGTTKEGRAVMTRPFQEQKKALVKGMEQYRQRVQTGIESKLRSKLVGELKDIVAKTKREIQQLKDAKASLEGELAQLRADIDNARNAGRQAEKTPPHVAALRDEMEQMETVLKHIGEELGTLKAGFPGTPRVTLMEAASVPSVKIRKRQLKFVGAASVGMFGLVFCCVAFLEFRARRVYTAGDVAQGLGINLVGTVPQVVLPSRPALPAPTTALALTEHSALTEAVDGIRTVLLRANRTEALRVVMVTSAVSGEGKTSLASHLAASLARGGRKTLLLDCDLRKPGVHGQFDLPLTPGFSEALRGEVPFDETVRPTGIDNLSLLPAGHADRRAIQALSQDGLGAIFDWLKQSYDFIIIDVSPLLPVPDSLLIGQYADAVLLAVMRNISRLPAIHAARQRLAALDIPMLGAIVIGEESDAYGGNLYPAQAAT